MSERTSRPRDVEPRRYLAQRRARIERLLKRSLVVPSAPALPPERRRFLREEAEELYWNELAWEKLPATIREHATGWRSSRSPVSSRSSMASCFAKRGRTRRFPHRRARRWWKICSSSSRSGA